MEGPWFSSCKYPNGDGFHVSFHRTYRPIGKSRSVYVDGSFGLLQSFVLPERIFPAIINIIFPQMIDSLFGWFSCHVFHVFSAALGEKYRLLRRKRRII